MKHQLDFEAIDQFSQTVINSIDFTKKSENAFYNAVDLKNFKDNDAETISRYLKNGIRLIPFCDYLKRYIYLKTGMRGDFQTIEIREYQHIITDSFAENSTPKSFTATSAKMSALAKNWLTQNSVSRSTMFLLGFGLNMNVKDVSDFLMKALREHDFNFKDPGEIIYWYCFKNCYKYPKMLTLQRQYDEMEASFDPVDYNDGTIGIRNTFKHITDDEGFLRYLSRFKNTNSTLFFNSSAARCFSELYLKTKSIIANYYNADETEQIDMQIEQYKSSLKYSSLTEIEKLEQIKKMRNSIKTWTYADITDSDVEKILCCGMPFNKNGNLEKLSASKLAKCFSNKRFSRQHITEVLSKAIPVDRFDLATLNFFLFSQDEKFIDDNKNRYIAFVDSTNEILEECMMGELYNVNPYESFLLMCILSDCPLATYADVWEMSYDEQ